MTINHFCDYKIKGVPYDNDPLGPLIYVREISDGVVVFSYTDEDGVGPTTIDDTIVYRPLQEFEWIETYGE